MKSFITKLPTLVALLLVVTGVQISAQENPGDEAGARELCKLQGIWTVASSEQHGEKRSDLEEVKKMRLTIKDDQWTLDYRNDSRDKYVATLKLDPTKTPKAVDLRFTVGLLTGATLAAIYELTGNDLKFCFPDESKQRPKNFDSTEGPGGRWLLVLKREK